MRCNLVDNQRGAALAIVVLIAIVCAVASYFALFAATSEARHSRFFHERAVARQAAEAGLVLAMQRLWSDPAYCGGLVQVPIPKLAAPPELIDVTIAVTPDCVAGTRKQLSASVDYWAAQ